MEDDNWEIALGIKRLTPPPQAKPKDHEEDQDDEERDRSLMTPPTSHMSQDDDGERDNPLLTVGGNDDEHKEKNHDKHEDEDNQQEQEQDVEMMEIEAKEGHEHEESETKQKKPIQDPPAGQEEQLDMEIDSSTKDKEQGDGDGTTTTEPKETPIEEVPDARKNKPLPPIPIPEKVKSVEQFLIEKAEVLMQFDESRDKFCWKEFFAHNQSHDMSAVPVEHFPLAPLAQIWDGLRVNGVKVEFPVELEEEAPKLKVIGYWIGTITRYFGYIVRVEEEGYPETTKIVPSQYLNFLKDCFSVGYFEGVKRAVRVPSDDLINVNTDWHETLVENLSNQVTLHIPSSFQTMIARALTPRFAPGIEVEVIDFSSFAHMKLGKIMDVKGSRAFVQYWDAVAKGIGQVPGTGIWCDVNSDWLRPLGWSHVVGVEVKGSPEFMKSPPLMPPIFFKKEQKQLEAFGNENLQPGMKLEAIFLPNRNYVMAATVLKVLNYGYFVAAFDAEFDEVDPRKKRHVYKCVFHISSSEIFQCGFCKEVGIPLIPPKGWGNQGEFMWDAYFEKTGEKPLEIKRSTKMVWPQSFIRAKLEAVDLSCPNASVIRVAHILDIKGPLICIRFLGWSEGFDQWMDHTSPDIYPVGYCDAVGCSLLGPRHVRDSGFWRKYKNPNEYANDLGLLSVPCRRSLYNPTETLNSGSESDSSAATSRVKILKKTLSSAHEGFNSSDSVKEAAIKLGTPKQRAKPLSKSTIEEMKKQKMGVSGGGKGKENQEAQKDGEETW